MEEPRQGWGMEGWGAGCLPLMISPSQFCSLQDGAAQEQILEVIGSGLENSLSKPISQGKSWALWHFKIK